MEILINNEKYNIDFANSFYQRLIGLMGKRNIQKGLLFKTGSIHTFFMKENIDVIMLNKEKKVIYFEKNVSKNRIIIKKKAQYTIELPHNSLKNIKLNDMVSIIF